LFVSPVVSSIADEDGANRTSSGAVLPSVKDPSLFLLRIGKGEREDDIVFQLLQQYYKREVDPDPSRRLWITSVFTTPASRGYIYVEAHREAHVEQAIKSLPRQRMVSYFANSKKNIKVPITEMVAAIKFRSNQQTVQLKQWVRFKRGPNQHDLAQVVNVQDQGTIITLKFVPRIDYNFLDAKRKNEKLTRQMFKASSGGAARKPPQKYFDEREVRGMGHVVEKKRGAGMDKHTTYFHFMNQKFKNGFQFKDTKIDGLVS
jgi:transcription elongation factor SPT5